MHKLSVQQKYKEVKLFTNYTQNERELYRVQKKKNSANDLYKLYNNYLHNITPKWIDLHWNGFFRTVPSVTKT